ncbi:MAG: ABC transporter substrate-binding protein [Gammaproteobacteria bacterium]|nr:ABC transporter substrate-binding protein [Gammaproteobacteria bacterium]
MNSRLLAVMLVTVFCSGLAQAQPYFPERDLPLGGTRQAQSPGPVMILRQGLKKLIAFAAAEGGPGAAQAEAFLEREIVPYFDFAYMARWAAGNRIWQRMGEAQQQEMENRIKQDFLTILAARLSGFASQQVQVMPVNRASASEVTVSVAILNPQTYPARLDFRFYRAQEGWKIFDVSANGSSAVMHYRTEFRTMLRERMMRPRGFRY